MGGGRELDPGEASRILDVYHRTRTRLPPVHGVAARPNVRRLASLGRRKGGSRVLNLAQVVVRAGEEAWAQVAPALEGDPKSLHRLRSLVDDDLKKARAQSGRRRPRRSLRCEGTPGERRRLETLLTRIRCGAFWDDLVPGDLELRISRRMTRSLGSCRFGPGRPRITLSARLFAPGLDDILEETLRHELAHLLDGRTRPDGRSDHGPSWRSWAVRLGARPERLCPVDDARRLAAGGDRPRPGAVRSR